ncbi:PucR family transcriptional regulator [[Mycobacterium] nativiensis]|uniref:Helix-turn-helix domain-containing protein n=1 Tax=[Mycobacterium] nativiensis TaxID=2855503 RepID=A0ABU5XQ08_9MYCO|nr:helix-turn-helix domain-containing protein [Mycolicibacter sp. MYC340]MEB3029998.1 helix-turn-helix domain-containing protein [Mycolicibacter sp. MYC340]
MRQRRDLVAEARTWFESFANREVAEPQLSTLSGRMIDAIAADVPEIGDDPALRQELQIAVHDGVGAYFSQGPHERPSDIDLPNAAKVLGRTLARRGYDIALLQRCYRTLQRISWAEIMTSACREITDPELLPAVLDLQWDHLSRTISHATERAEMAFLDETRRQVSSAQTRRRELVEAILREEAVDIERSTRQLGHNLHVQQTGLIIWTLDRPEDDATVFLETLAVQIATRLGAPRPLTLPAGGRMLWVWLATTGVPDLREIARLKEFRQHRPKVHLAAGIPAAGVEGFRVTHEEALRAYRIAAETDPAPVTLYRDVELVSCLAADIAALSRLVRRELGGLAERGAATDRLRQTALVYLEQGSMAKAAESLSVHKNTVLYRMQQVEELLPQPLDERRMPLEVALRVVATLGERVLPE